MNLGAQTALTVKNVKFANGYTSEHGGAIYAEACSLNMQGCEITGNKSDKTSSKNGNNGGAIYLHKDVTSASFKSCTFTNNQIVTTGTDQYGGAVRIEAADAANDVVFESCTFTGNFAKQAACISVNAKTRLYINDCLFEGNHANSRGMVQIANGVTFINGSCFHNNYTEANNGWGVDIHGKGYLAMNNVTFYGNYNQSTTAGNNNVAINGYHSLLMTNCTLIESNQLALIRIDDAAGRQVLCNNILINTADKTVLTGNTSAAFESRGHNAMSGVSSFDSFSAHATDLLTCTQASFASNSYSDEYSAFVWAGPLAGFTPATQNDVTTAMLEAFNVDISGVMSNIGSAFYDWLDDMSPKGYAVDGRGISRTGNWWPGAYQNN